MPLIKTFLLLGVLVAVVNAAVLPCIVVDKRTSLPVARASICVDGMEICVHTDTSGKAGIEGINPDIYSFTSSAPGYDTLKTANVLVKTGKNLSFLIELNRSDVINLDKMTVYSGRISPKRVEQSTSVTRLTTFDLANTAGTANDISRVIATLPSVVCLGTDMDNTLYVRGGASRENLFIVDGIEIDNISHFSDIGGSGGGMGYIDGSTVKGLDFYAGGIPASYPPAISSVIDIQLRDGSYTDIKGKAEANIAGLGLSLEGPLVKNKVSALACLRYLDLGSIEGWLPLNGVPRFGDGLLRFSWLVDERNSVSFTTFGGYDHYQEDANTKNWPFTSDYRQELFQVASALAWNYRSERLRNRLLASFRLRNEGEFEQVHNPMAGPVVAGESRYKNGRPAAAGDTVLNAGDTLVDIREVYTGKELWHDRDQRNYTILKDDAVIYFREKDQFGVGISGGITGYHLAHGTSRLTQYRWMWLADSLAVPVTRNAVDTPYAADSVVHDSTLGAYVQYVLSEGRLTVVGGVRADYFRLVRDFGVSPRLSATLSLPLGSISLSAGLLYQLPADLSDRLYDLMVPDPNYYRPKPPFWQIELQRNWQAALGFEREFAGSRIFTLETYFKWYDREYTRITPDFYQYEEEFQEALRSGEQWELSKPDGKKRVYGMELSFQKKQQKGFYYALGFSLFSAMDQYANGVWYEDENDLRTTLGLTLGAEFFRHHNISVRLTAADGRPYSVASTNAAGVFTYDSTAGYYTKRLDPSLSLNLRYGFNFFPKWGTVTGYIELWNVFNYQPVIERRLGASGYRDIRANGIIPLAGISAEF
jgi:hypothetical protein